MCGALYLKSSTLRVYEQQKKERGGLVSVGVSEPKSRMKHKTSQVTRKIATWGAAPRIPPATEDSWGTGRGTIMMTKPPWKSFPGMYHQRIEEGAGIKKYYQWIEKDGLEESSDHSSITIWSYQSLTSRQTSSCWPTNQPDIVVVNKVHLWYMWKSQQTARAEETTGADGKGKVQSGCSDRNIRSCEKGKSPYVTSLIQRVTNKRNQKLLLRPLEENKQQTGSVINKQSLLFYGLSEVVLK